MCREDEDELQRSIVRHGNQSKRGKRSANRVEQRLGRITENERETKDDGRKRNKRRQSVFSVEDKQTHEDDSNKSNGKQDRVQFGYSGAGVLRCC